MSSFEGKAIREAIPLILDEYRFRANVAVLANDSEVSLGDVQNPDEIMAIRVHELGDPHILYIRVQNGIALKAVEATTVQSFAP